MLTYIRDNFDYSPECGRLILHICAWASEHYEDKNGNLTEEGVHFVYYMLDSLGVEEQEIIDHWKED